MKRFIAIILLIFAICFAWYQYTKSNPTYQAERLRLETTSGSIQVQTDFEDRQGPPTTEERNKMRDEMYLAMGVTSDQKSKLEQIEKQFSSNDRMTSNSWRLKHDAQEQIFTPEQQQKRNDFFQSRRDGFVKRMQERTNQRLRSLSPADQETYKKKEAERRNHGGRGPGR